MLELYLAELRRFRKGAAACFAAHLILLTALQQLTNLIGLPANGHVVMLVFYMMLGLCFALYQFGTYRQPSRWIWLQHRPVHRAHILGALVLAAVTLLALGVALPLFILLFTQDRFTQTVVDARHYAGAAYLALSALSAWLAGGYIMLHRSRWAFVILLLPVVLTMHMATATTLLALALSCNLLLLGLLYTVFRPNRYTADDTIATVGTAVPMQAAFHVALLWGGALLFQICLMLAGAHPQASGYVPPGGYTEAIRFNTQEALRAGLANSTDPRAPGWRKTLDPRESAFVGPMVRQYAVHNLVSTVGLADFHEGENTWTFSHDHMRFHGMNRRTQADLGWFGAGGPGTAAPFDTQPIALRDNRAGAWLADAHNLYRIEADAHLRHALRVDNREQLAGGVAQLGQRMLVLTNRRLAILDSTGAQPSAATEIPLPLPFGDLERVVAAAVPDGTLVSFVYGHRQSDGVLAAPQLTYLVDAAGHVRQVARRELTHDFPQLFEHRTWWISPVLNALVELPNLLIDHGVIPDDGASRLAPLLRPRPAFVWAAAIVATLLSFAGAVWWTRGTRIKPAARAAWCLACLLLGAPGLLSLMVLQPRGRVERQRDASAINSTLSPNPANS